MLQKILSICIIIWILCIQTKESFSYDDEREYYYCKYRLDSNSPKCKSVFNNLYQKKQPLLVGIVYTKQEDNDKTYNLYKNIDERNNSYLYYIKIKQDCGNYIYKQIYSGNQQLFNGMEINIPEHNNNPYVIQLYDNTQCGQHMNSEQQPNSIQQIAPLTIPMPTRPLTNCRSCNTNPAGRHYLCKDCWKSCGTRYDESLIPWNSVGYIFKSGDDKRDRFYNLYEKSLDSSRNNYKYYIHDIKQDVKIELNDKEYLDSNQEIKINGKSGDYKIHRYDITHPSILF